MKLPQKDRILIVEDEPQTSQVLRDFFRHKNCETITAGSCAEAEDVWESALPDLAILDYALPDGNGLDLIPRLRAINQIIPIIILTGHGSIDLAVKAVKLGAEQFLTKPIDLELLWVTVQKTLENNRNHKQQLVAKVGKKQILNPFLGSSGQIRKLQDLALKIAHADNPVLILGETGTGKGVLARWLHHNSTRSSEPFVDLNCAGLSPELLESELFGHERGAFTGAVQMKVGLLEIAHKGTVLLDEIGDVDIQVQPKLLKVLEDKQFRRLGDTRERKVDIRLIAATHRDMSQLVHENKFRADLYFRINMIPLVVPPLRDRVQDIGPLAENILANITEGLGRGPLTLNAKALESLRVYSWPGNVRELRNVLERAVLLAEDSVLTETDLHFDVHLNTSALPISHFKNLDELERKYIEEILVQENGRVESAAKRLGMPRSSLYHKLKQFQIDPSGMRSR